MPHVTTNAMRALSYVELSILRRSRVFQSRAFTHNFIHLLKRQHNYTQKNESEYLTNQQHETLKTLLSAVNTMTTLLCSQKPKFFCRNLHFLLLTETDGNEQLNISMQQLTTSFDLVLKIFINAPTTV